MGNGGELVELGAQEAEEAWTSFTVGGFEGTVVVGGKTKGSLWLVKRHWEAQLEGR